MAYAHAAAWMRNSHVKIVSVSSRRKESARRLVDKFALDCTVGDNFDQVLGDDRVDIVNISGPNHVHAEQGIAAARAGKHILIEKPMVLSMQENRALRDAVAQAGVKSLASFVLRWNPMVVMFKSLLADDAIGKLFYAESNYWHRIGPQYVGWDWVHKKKTGGSVMLVAGCHAIDALRWLIGEEVAQVSAIANNERALYEFDANVMATLKFRNGAIGKVSTVFDCEMPYVFNFSLLGTEGAMRDNRLWSKKLLPGQTDWATVPTVLPDSGDVHHHAFDAEIDHLVDCIRQDQESHCNIADAYHTHEVCLAIDRSIAEGGQLVTLPLE